MMERAHGRTSASQLLAAAAVRTAALLAVALLAGSPAAAQAEPATVYRSIAVGDRIEAVLPAATDAGYASHAYTVSVPAGSGSLTIDVDAGDADVDLAVSSAGPITSFDGIDHLDLSPGGSPSFALASPSAGLVHFEVLNFRRSRAAYVVTVVAEGPAEAPSAASPDAPTPDQATADQATADQPTADQPTADAPPPNPLAGPADVPSDDRWIGTFRGQGLEVAVRPEADAYVGTLTLGARSYPFRAHLASGVLVGTFTSADAAFDFTASLDGDVLRLESGGAVYLTVRVPGGA